MIRAMRIAFLSTMGMLLASVVLAHESSVPLKGEQAFAVGFERWLAQVLPHAQASATIRLEGGLRHIKANGYPEHRPGEFPNSGNPHSIQRKNYELSVSSNPVKGAPKPLNRTPFGITINGVLMDPATAEFWRNDRRSGWNYEAFGGACRLGVDRNNAHVQPNGAYHYHGIPTGLLERFAYRKQPALIGYAADGFPVYGPWGYGHANDPTSPMKELVPGYSLRTGRRDSGPGGVYDGTFTKDYIFQVGRGDLDECNGRSGVTPEYPNGTYYYVLSENFPHIPRCLRGDASVSFSRLKAGGRGGGGMRPRRPRPGGAMDHPPRPGMQGGPPPGGRPGGGPCKL